MEKLPDKGVCDSHSEGEFMACTICSTWQPGTDGSYSRKRFFEEVSSSAIVTARAISKLHKSTGIGVLAAAVLLQLNQPCSSEACGKPRSRRRRKPERSQVAAAAAPAAEAAAAEVQAVLSN